MRAVIDEAGEVSQAVQTVQNRAEGFEIRSVVGSGHALKNFMLESYMMRFILQNTVWRK